jgi:hypothetical protein
MRVPAPLARTGHLARRFAGSLRARPLAAADVGWVQSLLTPAELAVWERLGPADRAESVAVARRVARALGDRAEPVLVAAALVHDVGKVHARLGTVGRSAATVLAAAVGHRRARRFANRVGRYVNHDELGGADLRAAGARPELAAWAEAHHRPQLWPGTGLAPEVCAALAAADGE